MTEMDGLNRKTYSRLFLITEFCFNLILSVCTGFESDWSRFFFIKTSRGRNIIKKTTKKLIKIVHHLHKFTLLTLFYLCLSSFWLGSAITGDLCVLIIQQSYFNLNDEAQITLINICVLCLSRHHHSLPWPA